MYDDFGAQPIKNGGSVLAKFQALLDNSPSEYKRSDCGFHIEPKDDPSGCGGCFCGVYMNTAKPTGSERVKCSQLTFK